MNDAILDIRLDQGTVRLDGPTSGEIGHDLMRVDGTVRPNLRAGWDWDGQALRAWTDPTGFVPLYYAAGGDRLVLGTGLAAVARRIGGGPPNWDALSVFLRLGFFLAEDTPFRDIRILPPDAVLTWRNGQLRLDGGIRMSQVEDIGRAEALAAYADLFRQAVARRVMADDCITLPLSGGRDSRHILLELEALGHRPIQTLTVLTADQPGGDANGAVADILAQRVGTRQDWCHAATGRAATAEKNRLTGFGAAEHTWYMGLLPAVASIATCAFDGLAGDVLSNGHWFKAERLAKLRAGDVDTLAGDLLAGRPEPTFMPTGLARQLHPDRARARLAAELARHIGAPNPIASFVFWNRTRRSVSTMPLGLLASRVPVRVPFLDPDLRGFLMGLPAESFGPRGFHDEVIAAAYPQYADIGYEGAACPPRPSRRRAVIAAADGLLGLGSPWLRTAAALRGAAACIVTGDPDRVTWWRSRVQYFDQLRREAGLRI